MPSKTERRVRYASRVKFNKVHALNELIDSRTEVSADARKAKRKMADHWGKRKSNNTGDLFKPTNAKPGVMLCL